MNNLSIVLYLIDVLGNLQGLMIGVSVFGGCGAGLLVAYWCCETRYYNQAVHRPFHGAILVIACIFIAICALIAVFIPSKQTMQMIAVSEASEMVIMNEEVREVMTDIKDVLKTQLGKLKE